MGLESVNDTSANSTVTNPVTDYANKINAEKEEKRIAYEAAMQQQEEAESIFKRVEAEYLSAKRDYDNGHNVDGFESIKSKYNSAFTSSSDASNLVSIKRSSYQDSIFFSGKINNLEAIASAILG